MRQSRSPNFSFLLAVAVCATTTSALAGIDDLAGTKPGELPFGGQFENADGCALCHGGGFAGDRSYLPHDSWAGTMMGNAARDPIFRAALAIANQDVPGIGTFCLRCHSPIAFVRGHATPADGSSFDVVDMQGIGCDTCHRAITSGPAESPYHLGDAQIEYSADVSKRGPYADSVAHVHTTAFEPALSSSHFCGQCHQVTIPGRPLRDALGQPTAIDFPLDTTYQEWRSSSFSAEDGASCIDCHSERKQDPLPVVTLPGAPFRDQVRDHAFVGGNLFGIRAVMATSPDRALAYPAAFDLALDRTEKLLRSAAKIDIVAAPTNGQPGDSIDITVRVENLTGHKFPTGYAEGRRAWVAIALVSESSEETFLLGGYDAVKGEIEAFPPTHIYRAQHGRWNGTAPEPAEDLARHDMIISDTRIPPKGFVAELATNPTAEIDYGNPSDGFRPYDEATFSITLPATAGGSNTLSARIYYQSVTRKYIEHLAAVNTTDSSGQELLSTYESLGAAPPFVVASAEESIFIGDVVPASSSSSSGAAGAGGSSNGSGGLPPTNAGSCDCATGGRPATASMTIAAFLLSALSLIHRRRKAWRNGRFGFGRAESMQGRR